ncbi:hypothetical protein lerEdw1_015576 [Lerista edwardsae]|nr:hypothetical protein lerEdw1_015576 [Lerista edwardsae]
MLWKNGVELEVYPQETGTHSLKIFAKPFKDKTEQYSRVLEYSLKCSSVDKSTCLPRALIQPVGPSWLSEESGILNALPASPIIHTDDGRCIVTFTRSKNLDLFATQDSDTSTVPDWKTRGEMAFHDGLSRTQQILLAIFCFPLLPFYLCYLCFAKSKEKEGKPDTLDQKKEENFEEVNGQPKFTADQTDVKNSDGHHPDVLYDDPYQGEQVTVEIHPRHSTPEIENKGSFRKDDHVTVEIHPRQMTPQMEYKALFGKGVKIFPSVMGQENQGFQDDGEEKPSLGEQYLFAYPWDKSSLKSMPVDLRQFKKLDAYAAKVSTRSNVEGLVSVLLQEAHSDLEKVRAIWIWICHHIEYDVKAYHNEALRRCEPSDVLRSGKGVCAGYSGLFEKMCSIAGIECKTLSGFSKGYSYKIGKILKDTDHAWNAVYLDGKWHLLDCTWGSGNMDESCTRFTFRYDEFYFLTHPALFISEHLPKDHQWQLLKPALTLQQFEHNLRYNSDFYTIGLVAASPQTSVIETENGKATVLIESRSPTLFLGDLNGVKENCLIMLQKNGVELEVYPQETGTHSLKIFAKSSNDKTEQYSRVLEYSLKCSSVDKSTYLPRALIQPVGPSWLSEESGILNALPASPVIHTDDGRCIVTFTRSKDLNFFATLDSDTSTVPESTRRRHVWRTCRGSQVELKIHLPHAGDFALHIWTKKMSDAGANHCALSYVLSCQNESVQWPHFPQNYTNWEDGFELVAPLAGVLPADREVEFKLRLPGVTEVSVECGKKHKLALSGDGFWEGACHTSGASKVTVEISKNATTFWSLLEYKVEMH